jgi:hypothetical protein
MGKKVNWGNERSVQLPTVLAMVSAYGPVQELYAFHNRQRDQASRELVLGWGLGLGWKVSFGMERSNSRDKSRTKALVTTRPNAHVRARAHVGKIRD